MPGLKSFAFATLLSVAASYAVAEQITQNTSPPVDNPIVLQRADPMLVRHEDTKTQDATPSLVRRQSLTKLNCVSLAG